MNTLTIVVIACLAIYASAKPSGLWGYGHGLGHGYGHGHGHLPVVGASGVVSSGGAAGPAGIVNGHGAIGPNGHANAIGHDGAWGDGAWAGHHDDGQWHGEGLLESQDWASHGHGHGGIVGHGAGLVGLGHLGIHGVHGIGYGHGHW